MGSGDKIFLSSYREKSAEIPLQVSPRVWLATLLEVSRLPFPLGRVENAQNLEKFC